MSKEVDQFVQDMLAISGFEYGDFKRKAGSYLNRLDSQARHPEAKNRISRIRDYLVFRPTGSMEEVLEQVLMDIEEVRPHF